MNVWAVWLKGLVGAIIGGVANAVLLTVTMPSKFSFSDIGTLAQVAAGASVISAAMFLAKSPLPGIESTRVQTTQIQSVPGSGDLPVVTKSDVLITKRTEPDTGAPTPTTPLVK